MEDRPSLFPDQGAWSVCCEPAAMPDTLRPHGSRGFYRQGSGGPEGGVTGPRTHSVKLTEPGLKPRSTGSWPRQGWDQGGVSISGPGVCGQSDSGYTAYLHVPVPLLG